MGQLIQFPNRPECPPHDWVEIWDLDPVLDEEFISGRICVKCSLIETKESRTFSNARGIGPGFLSLWIKMTFGE